MLLPLSPGLMPLGFLDVLDSQLDSLKGGEVMTIGEAARTNSSTETAAADQLDGYDYERPIANAERPVTRLATTAVLPVFLSDEGLAGYGNLLGQLVGSKTGLVVSGGTNAGPHSAAASGKVTLWDKPGVYTITVDALAATFVSSLQAGGLTPGSVLGHTSAGLLQHSTANGAVAGTGVATFLEFSANDSLVTTRATMVGAAATFDRIKIAFSAGWGTRTVPTHAS